MTTNKAGPFYDAFEGSVDGVIRQELITYKIKNGVLVIEKTQRDYSGNDYQDTASSTPLVEVK